MSVQTPESIVESLRGAHLAEWSTCIETELRESGILESLVEDTLSFLVTPPITALIASFPTQQPQQQQQQQQIILAIIAQLQACPPLMRTVRAAVRTSLYHHRLNADFNVLLPSDLSTTIESTIRNLVRQNRLLLAPPPPPPPPSTTTNSTTTATTSSAAITTSHQLHDGNLNFTRSTTTTTARVHVDGGSIDGQADAHDPSSTASASVSSSSLSSLPQQQQDHKKQHHHLHTHRREKLSRNVVSASNSSSSSSSLNVQPVTAADTVVPAPAPRTLKSSSASSKRKSTRRPTTKHVSAKTPSLSASASSSTPPTTTTTTIITTTVPPSMITSPTTSLVFAPTDPQSSTISATTDTGTAPAARAPTRNKSSLSTSSRSKRLLERMKRIAANAGSLCAMTANSATSSNVTNKTATATPTTTATPNTTAATTTTTVNPATSGSTASKSAASLAPVKSPPAVAPTSGDVFRKTSGAKTMYLLRLSKPGTPPTTLPTPEKHSLTLQDLFEAGLLQDGSKIIVVSSDERNIEAQLVVQSPTDLQFIISGPALEIPSIGSDVGDKKKILIMWFNPKRQQSEFFECPETFIRAISDFDPEFAEGLEPDGWSSMLIVDNNAKLTSLFEIRECCFNILSSKEQTVTDATSAKTQLPPQKRRRLSSGTDSTAPPSNSRLTSSSHPTDGDAEMELDSKFTDEEEEDEMHSPTHGTDNKTVSSPQSRRRNFRARWHLRQQQKRLGQHTEEATPTNTSTQQQPLPPDNRSSKSGSSRRLEVTGKRHRKSTAARNSDFVFFGNKG